MGIRFQGCTPGFWKQPQHFDSWIPTGFSPSNDFDTIFGRDAFNPDITLLQALNLGGGGLNALARQAVAAILNAAHPNINYPFTVSQIISMFQSAFDSGNYEPTKDQFDDANNQGCPLS